MTCSDNVARGAAHRGRLAHLTGGLYSRRPNHILPFVGEAFERPTKDLLRVVVVGINSYVSPQHWPVAPGGGFPEWFLHTKYRFFGSVKRNTTRLVSGLVDNGLFEGLRFDWPASFYGTNAIKAYLPEAEGKRADQVASQLFAEHASTWRDELDLMAEHGALPQLIVIFGEPFWAHACSSFRAPHAKAYQHLRVLDYEHAPGPSLHFANRLRLGGANGEQTTFLVRLRHPSSRTKKGSVKWLLGQDDFRRLVAG